MAKKIASRKISILVKTMRILFLLILLCAAYLLYSLAKVRGTASVVVAPASQVVTLPLYKHVEHLSVKIGSPRLF